MRISDWSSVECSSDLAEFDADPAHFVLEQFPQRFDQLEFHVRRQAADVVMDLDDVCLAGLAAGRLDDIRIDRALREELHVRNLRGFIVEYIEDRKSTRLNSSH